MQFRIGINLGDVIEEEDRIYGDGVNIAARLESLGARWHLCLQDRLGPHRDQAALGVRVSGRAEIVTPAAKLRPGLPPRRSGV
jgi:class 3 adenylate cyclase